jgi:hypothetical protein
LLLRETGWLFDAERSDLAADRLGKLAADRKAFEWPAKKPIAGYPKLLL